MAYDSAGRLVSACQSTSCSGSGFNRVDATYDGAGHRTALKETTSAGVVTTTTFAYQGDAIVSESVNGTVSKTYVVDDGGRITKVCVPDCTGSNPVYLVTWNGHGDALGLWRQNADGTLTLANGYQYSTWGTPTTTVAPGFTDLGFRFLYVGASDVQWDSGFGLGLLYMHARHYSPTIGRFLQPDPVRADTSLYAYAESSPVTKTDPTGHACQLAVFGGVLALLGACAGEIALGLLVFGTAWLLNHAGPISLRGTASTSVLIPRYPDCGMRMCPPNYRKPETQVPGLFWHVDRFFGPDATWLAEHGQRGRPSCFKENRRISVRCVIGVGGVIIFIVGVARMGRHPD